MSLTACIKKAAKAISPQDGEYLIRVRSELIQEGMSAVEADRAAVQSLLEESQTELKELSLKVEEQGGAPLWKEIAEAGRSNEIALASVTARTPELQEGIRQLEDGEIEQEQYAGLVDEFKPVQAYESVPEPEQDESAVAALTEDKRERYGAAREVEDGTPVAVRLDIPAYRDNGTWVVSIHEQKPGNSASSFQAGKSIGYDSVAVINDVNFGMPEKGAMNIAKGKPKGTIATMKGTWQNMSPADAKALADEAMSSDEWIQVGMDPERHSYFYDRGDHRVPVLSADQVVQVGPLVLAKNVVTGKRDDFLFSVTRKPAMNPVDLDAVINRVAPNWDPSDANSPVVVLETLADAPKDVLRDLGPQNPDLAVRGLYHNGKVYLVRDQMDSAAKAEEVLLHEATHRGMLAAYSREKSGAAVFAATNNLWVALGGKGADLNKIAEELGVAKEKFEPYWEQAKAANDGDVGRYILVSELVALVGEKGAPKRLREKIREWIGAVRAWLREKGFFKLADYNASDIADLARKSREVGLSNVDADNAPVLFSYEMDINRKERTKAKRVVLSAEEKAALGSKELQDKARDRKAQYPQSEGWAPFKVSRVKVDDKGQEKIEYKAIPYGYNKPIAGVSNEVHLESVAQEMADLVLTVYDRAKTGDKNAEVILAQKSWYKGVTERLRQEFGGTADTLADLLGSTSPNTPVDTNFRFSVEILRRFVRGDFNSELAAYDRWIKAGKSLTKFPRKDKLEQISGKLYGMNSDGAATALLNLYRDIKPGSAPKARNFALNLIGQSDMATIDVWAARMLRRSANNAFPGKFPRIPPAAEQGVTGNWNAKVTKVTGEFGFGAEAMQRTSDILAEKGIKIDAPDLQAVSWFAEKELWGENGWTTVTGEGGSFEQKFDEMPMERYVAGFAIETGEVVPTQEDMSAVQDRTMLALVGDDKVVAARAVPTKGLYAGDIENSFDTEWTVEEGYDPSAVMSEIAAIAQENDQIDIFVSRVVKPEEDNPNARPGVEVYFKTRQDFEMVKPTLEAFTERGVDGFTLVVDPRAQDGEYIGVRLQFVPEISVRWDEEFRAELLAEGGIERVLVEQADILEDVVAELRSREEVAYASLFKYDTVVVGKENYDALTNRGNAGQDRAAGSEVRFGQPVRSGLEAAVRRYDSQPRQVDSGSLPDVSEDVPSEKVVPPLASVSEADTPAFELSPETAGQYLIRRVQDKFVQVKRLQTAIENQTGKPIPRDKNVYLSEQFYTGIVEERLLDIELKIIKPMMDYMSEYDLTVGEVDLYLIAKHAPERNATIAERRKDLQDGGSGMTNADAKQVIAEFNAAGKLKGLSKVVPLVRKLVEEGRSALKDSDLTSDAQDYRLANKWKFYVPLKGFSEDEESDGNTFRNTGKGFDVRGREFNIATGRTSMPDSPIANLLADVTASIVRAEKSAVAKKLYELVKANPNPEYWEILTDDSAKEYSGLDKKGLAKLVKKNPQMMPDVFAVKVNGEIEYIRLSDELLVTAMRNMGPEQLKGAIEVLNRATRFMSSMNTSLSPEFFIDNGIRDLQTAYVGMEAELSSIQGKLKGAKMGSIKGRADFFKDTFRSYAAIQKFQRARYKDGNYEPKDALQKDYAEFLKMGAKTGFFDSPDVDQIKKDLNNLLNLQEKTTSAALRRSWRNMLRHVDQLNTSVENGVRLSAYKMTRDLSNTAFLESGYSKEEAYEQAKTIAADLAKNLTVNFNRKGELGQTLNAMFMFFNASVQGNVQFAKYMAPLKRERFVPNPKLKADFNNAHMMAGLGMAVGATLMLLNRMAGGEDDDGVAWVDKIPVTTRVRKAVILKSVFGGEANGEYYSFPLPYGYNIFHNAGDVAEGLTMSEYAPRRDGLLGQMAYGTVNSFVPIGIAAGESAPKSAVITLTPSVVAPLMEIATNQSGFSGGPVYKEAFGSEANSPTVSNMAFRSTNPAFQSFTSFVNEMAGGSTYVSSGMLTDISPDGMSHMVEFLGAGPLRTLGRSYEVGSAKIQGRELKENKIPWWRSFAGEVGDYGDTRTFYDRVNEITSLNQQKKNATTEREMDFVAERGWKLGLQPAAKKAQKELKKIRDRRDKLQASKNLSAKAKDDLVKIAEDQMDSVVDRFNQIYNEAEKQAGG